MGLTLNCSGYNIVKTDIVRALDCYLYDSKGNRYVDLEAGVWCTVLGHNNSRVNQAIRTQMEQVCHLGYRYINSKLETAAALTVLETVKFKRGKCVFLSSGSEAVEFGVQIAKQLMKKPYFLTMSDSYLGAYGSAGRKNAEEWYCFDWSSCKQCDQTSCGLTCIHFQQIPFASIGAFVFEPGSTSGLVKLPPQQLVTALAAQIRQQRGLIIVDEVTTGMGRTGKWYGYEHYNIRPDVVAIGKGVGNGFPVSVVVMSEEVAQELEHIGFRYAQSHQNDPLGCIIVKEVISAIEDEQLVQRSCAMGTRLLEGLQKLGHSHACIREVRGRGLMAAVEFRNDDPKFSLETAYLQLVDNGFLAGFKPAANLLRFYPALTIREEIIDSLVSCLDQVLP